MFGQIMTWGGAVLTLGGVFGLIHCGRLSMKAKALPEEAARKVMERVVILNVSALGLAMLGLMVVVAGLFLR
jgi:hypothetical protein